MKVLFGVFDWGLGHATRDVPLIEELLRQGNTVHIISTGRALALLRQHFGRRCGYFDVPSIGNPYTRTRFFTLSFILSAPRMMHNLGKIRKMTAEIIRRGKYDKVVTDCRFDVYDRVENSYLINHQLRFKSPIGTEFVGERWLARHTRNFGGLIVPDFERDDLTGRLSHDVRHIDNSKIRHIGVLSQLRRQQCRKDIDCFISISGPEPQRTMLEQRILGQVGKLKGRIVITLGIPERKSCERKGNITIYGFLDSQEQERMMNRAKMVVTRPGYTTMMELYELRAKHALLIPTPGQTEQEYLAGIYESRGEFHHVSQYRLDLLRDIEAARRFSGFRQQWTTKESVARFMAIIQPRPVKHARRGK